MPLKGMEGSGTIYNLPEGAGKNHENLIKIACVMDEVWICNFTNMKQEY